jgi:hypothetical protein
VSLLPARISAGARQHLAWVVELAAVVVEAALVLGDAFEGERGLVGLAGRVVREATPRLFRLRGAWPLDFLVAAPHKVAGRLLLLLGRQVCALKHVFPELLAHPVREEQLQLVERLPDQRFVVVRCTCDGMVVSGGTREFAEHAKSYECTKNIWSCRRARAGKTGVVWWHHVCSRPR